MQETEPEAALHATADLSPVSPLPVHTAAPLVVPALQHTVDTIDAMVVAAAAAASPGGGIGEHPADNTTAHVGEIDDVVDDDSFSDAYGEDTPEAPVQLSEQEPADSNDDYAKTFDSPINPEEGEEGQDPQQHVQSVPRESNDISLPSDHLTCRPSDAPQVTLDPLLDPATAANSAAQPNADAEPGAAASSHPADIPSAHASEQLPGASSASRESEHPVDIQQLVAELTSQPSPEPNAGLPDPSPALTASAEAPATSSSMPSTALPPSSSLPPRPPLPQTSTQSYASQHHPQGSNSNTSANAVAPPTPGQLSTYVLSGAPGTSSEGLGSLPPPPATGLNTLLPVTSLNPPSYPIQPPAYSTDRGQENEFQRQWDQFMADERQYMSEAKWDRFPDGSRIFIGKHFIYLSTQLP